MDHARVLFERKRKGSVQPHLLQPDCVLGGISHIRASFPTEEACTHWFTTQHTLGMCSSVPYRTVLLHIGETQVSALFEALDPEGTGSVSLSFLSFFFIRSCRVLAIS
jgi:hypothetical protein